MSRAVVRAAVKERIEANWTTTPLVYQTTDTAPPLSAGGNLRPYVFVEITHNSTYQASIGSESRATNLWREDGLVFFHIYTPTSADGSVDLSDQYADAMVELFRGVQIAPDLKFGNFTGDVGGPGDDNGNYYRVSLSVEWDLN
jgi:hypothetical protein